MLLLSISLWFSVYSWFYIHYLHSILTNQQARLLPNSHGKHTIAIYTATAKAML